MYSRDTGRGNSREGGGGDGSAAPGSSAAGHSGASALRSALSSSEEESEDSSRISPARGAPGLRLQHPMRYVTVVSNLNQ